VKEFPGVADGSLSLPSLVRLIGKVNDAEDEALSAHYQIINNATDMRPILQLGRRYPRITKPDGIGVDSDLLKTLRAVPSYGVRPAIREGKIERIRLTEATLPSPAGKSSRIIRFEGLVEKQWQLLGAFTAFFPGREAVD